jgi:hypothetical protein
MYRPMAVAERPPPRAVGSRGRESFAEGGRSRVVLGRALCAHSCSPVLLNAGRGSSRDGYLPFAGVFGPWTRRGPLHAPPRSVANGATRHHHNGANRRPGRDRAGNVIDHWSLQTKLGLVIRLLRREPIQAVLLESHVPVSDPQSSEHQSLDAGLHGQQSGNEETPRATPATNLRQTIFPRRDHLPLPLAITDSSPSTRAASPWQMDARHYS